MSTPILATLSIEVDIRGDGLANLRCHAKIELPKSPRENLQQFTWRLNAEGKRILELLDGSPQCAGIPRETVEDIISAHTAWLLAAMKKVVEVDGV